MVFLVRARVGHRGGPIIGGIVLGHGRPAPVVGLSAHRHGSGIGRPNTEATPVMVEPDQLIVAPSGKD